MIDQPDPEPEPEPEPEPAAAASGSAFSFMNQGADPEPEEEEKVGWLRYRECEPHLGHNTTIQAVFRFPDLPPSSGSFFSHPCPPSIGYIYTRPLDLQPTDRRHCHTPHASTYHCMLGVQTTAGSSETSRAASIVRHRGLQLCNASYDLPTRLPRTRILTACSCLCLFSAWPPSRISVCLQFHGRIGKHRRAPGRRPRRKRTVGF